jgi:hypothetical protein
LRLLFAADASATLAFCPVDGGSDEIVDLRQQGQHPSLQAVDIERIKMLFGVQF